jgi:hypothetical protein
LIGTNGGADMTEYQGAVRSSYSTGAVSAGPGSFVGGVEGRVYIDTSEYTYWDITTSGVTQSDGSVISHYHDGPFGYTTEELQTRTLDGFDLSVWSRAPNINGGLPYLLNNPPPG